MPRSERCVGNIWIWGRAVGFACLGALLPACDGARWNGPEAAYAAYAAAVQRKDRAHAYAALSTATRDLYQSKADAISKASGGAIKPDPVILVFLTGVEPAPITQIKRVREESSQAVVAITAGGLTSEQRLVKEADQWKVDLIDVLKSKK
jgi:hypothetical protein